MADTGELKPGMVLGHCRIERMIGGGGMGEVYLAEHMNLKKLVAIKTARAKLQNQRQARERFWKEAQLAAKVDHQNVIRIHDVGESNGLLYIVMQFVEGRDLSQILKAASAPLEWRPVLTWIRDAAKGLDAVHKCGLIHRDIKPHNIMLTPAGRVVVMDFGLVREQDPNASVTSGIVGSPAYMSPEQSRSERLDHRTDIYSLGATAYNLLSGNPPFPEKSIHLVILKLAENTVAKRLDSVRPDIPVKVADIVARSMAPVRDERISDAQALAAEIDRVLQDLPEPDAQGDRHQTHGQFQEAVRRSPAPEAALELGGGHCPACGSKNDPGRNYCCQCAAKLRVSCLSCAVELPVWENICGECGANQRELIISRDAKRKAQITDGESCNDAAGRLKSHAVGIDLGTTYSFLAYLNERGEPVTLANLDGELSTPSVVLYEGGTEVVGTEALRNAIIHPDRVIQNAKWHMGFGKTWTIDGKQLTPVDVSAAIVRKLLTGAQRQIGKFERAVITVPARVTDAQRERTVEAGMMAGLKQVDIIKEPVAATLCHVFGQDGLRFSKLAEEKRFIVYDLGRGPFDLSLVSYHKNEIRVLDSTGDRELGGIDWNQTLLNAVADQFTAEFGADPRSDPESLRTLLLEVEQCRRSLTARAKASVICQHATKRKAYQIDIEQFNDLTANLLNRTEDITKQLLKENVNRGGKNLQPTIIAIGEYSRMPMVKAMLHRLNGTATDTSLSPDQAIVHGAAYYAGMLPSLKIAH